MKITYVQGNGDLRSANGLVTTGTLVLSELDYFPETRIKLSVNELIEMKNVLNRMVGDKNA